MLTGSHPFLRRHRGRHGDGDSPRRSAAARPRGAVAGGRDHRDHRALPRQAPGRSPGIGARPGALPRSRRLGRDGDRRARRGHERSAPRAESHPRDLLRAADAALDVDLGFRAGDGRSRGHRRDRRGPDAGRSARAARAARPARQPVADRAAGRVVSRAEGTFRHDRRGRRFTTSSCPTSSAIPARRCWWRSTSRGSRSRVQTTPPRGRATTGSRRWRAESTDGRRDARPSVPRRRGDRRRRRPGVRTGRRRAAD